VHPHIRPAADPVRAFASGDHPEARVVEDEGVRAPAIHDHLNASAVLAYCNDSSFAVSHCNISI
jgi:hypothetical protein